MHAAGYAVGGISIINLDSGSAEDWSACDCDSNSCGQVLGVPAGVEMNHCEAWGRMMFKLRMRWGPARKKVCEAHVQKTGLIV